MPVLIAHKNRREAEGLAAVLRMWGQPAPSLFSYTMNCCVLMDTQVTKAALTAATT